MAEAARRGGSAAQEDWLADLVAQLVASGAARLQGQQLLNA